MNQQQYHWVCSYDICHPKRLRKLHDLLAMLGVAINYSVFYLYLTMQQFEKLCQQIKKIIQPKDDVGLFRCQNLAHAVYLKSQPLDIFLLNARGCLFGQQHKLAKTES